MTGRGRQRSRVPYPPFVEPSVVDTRKLFAVRRPVGLPHCRRRTRPHRSVVFRLGQRPWGASGVVGYDCLYRKPGMTTFEAARRACRRATGVADWNPTPCCAKAIRGSLRPQAARLCSLLTVTRQCSDLQRASSTFDVPRSTACPERPLETPKRGSLKRPRSGRRHRWSDEPADPLDHPSR